MWQLIKDNWMCVVSEVMEVPQEPTEQHNSLKMLYPGVLGRIPLFLGMKQRNPVGGVLVAGGYGKVEFVGAKPLIVADEYWFIKAINEAIALDKDFYKVLLPYNENVKALTEIVVNITDTPTKFKHSTPLFHIHEKQDDKTVWVRFKAEFKDMRNLHKRLINMVVWNQMSFLGKALYRFIACQDNRGFYQADTLKAILAPMKDNDHFIVEIKSQLQRLIDLDVLDGFEVRGKGRIKKILWIRK